MGPAGAAVLTAALCVFATAGDAKAYCRTTTVLPPLGYNPAVSGCWAEGVPLVWSTNRAPYGVASVASHQVSLTDATRIADAAFGTWNATMCDGEPIGLEAYDDGPIDIDASYLVAQGSDASALTAWAACSDSSSCNAASHDVIVFDDDGWPHDDPVNTLALTTVTYGLDDGKIFEAYTEVNSSQNTLTTTEPPPTDGVGYDLQAILTHEAGHFFGLAHSADTSAVMYAFYKPGAIALTDDDVQAICAAQPPPSTPSGGCAMSPARGAATFAILPAVALLMLSRRRRSA